jgi:hypothetical protein
MACNDKVYHGKQTTFTVELMKMKPSVNLCVCTVYTAIVGTVQSQGQIFGRKKY